jgi:hypothetical protein
MPHGRYYSQLKIRTRLIVPRGHFCSGSRQDDLAGPYGNYNTVEVRTRWAVPHKLFFLKSAVSMGWTISSDLINNQINAHLSQWHMFVGVWRSPLLGCSVAHRLALPEGRCQVRILAGHPGGLFSKQQR